MVRDRVTRRILVLNGTTLVKGGGVQACAGFVQAALSAADQGVHWHFFISAQVAEQLESLGCRLDERFRVFSVSPARNRGARRALRQAVEGVGADAVFTFFGPAYVRFRQPHLCGVADGWVTHATWLAYSRLRGWKARLMMFALCMYKAFWFRRADAWVVEAECARRGLAQRYLLDRQRIHVVANNCGEQYVRASVDAPSPDWGDAVRVLTLSAYYPNKNHALIADVAEVLEARQPGRFRFVLTLSEADPEAAAFLASLRSRGLGEVVQNVGPVSLADGPGMYASCHVAFLPSLLETFSANYPEAMCMHRPVVTSDLDFARDVCGNAALFVDPLDAPAAADALQRLASDASLRQQLIADGARVQAALPDQQARYRAYRELLLALCRQ